jgi:phosphoserine phosphatase
MRRLGLHRSQTLAIGDGANDVPMLRAAGVSVAFRGKRAAVDAAIHTLDHAGLDGALNLFIE